jgi:hypothetical protein
MPDGLNAENFLLYAKRQFSNKFPFDVIGTVSIINKGCPTIILFNYEQEFCLLNDKIKYLKYPLWIYYLIRMVTYV